MIARLLLLAALTIGCKCAPAPPQPVTNASASAAPSEAPKPCNGCRHGLDPASADRVEQRQMQQIGNQFVGGDDDD